ncbi:unnamed protein product [Rangifer tarandus platyrhynchus]|uniref:Uncharacterized protein n=2 Tax=Rangifer tarandus platyrhynchus TaxID=3082113 RepID=A0ACB0ETU2_RANTA|nr:unnamed protein product [Rangifer tarandus platyrhynchus]CAI9703854.1 unnamed protein product [Rangifer tarandus platyrhynchus]
MQSSVSTALVMVDKSLDSGFGDQARYSSVAQVMGNQSWIRDPGRLDSVYWMHDPKEGNSKQHLGTQQARHKEGAAPNHWTLLWSLNVENKARCTIKSAQEQVSLCLPQVQPWGGHRSTRDSRIALLEFASVTAMGPSVAKAADVPGGEEDDWRLPVLLWLQ